MDRSPGHFDPFDIADLERRRAAAYRQVPALRQQALDDALRGAGRLIARGLRRLRSGRTAVPAGAGRPVSAS
jgi:hypothetical protein